MRRRIEITTINFIIVGMMSGLILGLVTSFFVDYMITNLGVICPISFLEWMIVICPLYMIVGGIFNAAVGVSIWEEPKKKRLLFFFKKK